VLPASQTRDKDALTEEGVEKVLKELEHMGFDYVVCDSPAGIERGAVMALTFADEALIVTNPEVSSVRDSDRILGIMQAKSRRAIEGGEPVKEHLLITRYSPEARRGRRNALLQGHPGNPARADHRRHPGIEEVLHASNQGTPVIHLKDSDVPKPTTTSSTVSSARTSRCASSTTKSRACSSDCSEANDMSCSQKLFGNKPKTAADGQGTPATDHRPRAQRRLSAASRTSCPTCSAN
jgi:hypothetical protein